MDKFHDALRWLTDLGATTPKSLHLPAAAVIFAVHFY